MYHQPSRTSCRGIRIQHWPYPFPKVHQWLRLLFRQFPKLYQIHQKITGRSLPKDRSKHSQRTPQMQQSHSREMQRHCSRLHTAILKFVQQSSRLPAFRIQIVGRQSGLLKKQLSAVISASLLPPRLQLMPMRFLHWPYLLKSLVHSI